jgi:hypothetical protein
MWLATRYGFYSIACARKNGGRSNKLDPNLLMVRARQERHLENLRQRFPTLAKYDIKSNAGTDYAYRLIVPKTVWAGIVAELVQEQTWANFKDEAARFLGNDYNDYHAVLHQVWAIMYDLQVHEPKMNRHVRNPSLPNKS